MLTIILIIAGCVLLLLGLLWLWFSRPPHRIRVRGEKSLVSPANGVVSIVQPFSQGVLRVKKWNRGTATFSVADVAKEGMFVLILMNPLHVHYQRAPYLGKILSVKHTRGSFRNALNDSRATFENERNEILMKTVHGKMKVVQIAGVLARRISCYVQPKQAVVRGRTIGFINLGSQTALVLPKNVRLTIKEGQTVIDGQKIGEFI